MEAAGKRDRREREAALSAAWMAAALQRQKKLMPLAVLLGQPPRRQSWREQQAIMGQWRAALQRPRRK